MKDAIIIEGGALRGIHTSGILDVLMNNRIYPSCVMGVSAGALNAFNYVARQPGRSARINLEYINDDRYFNLMNVVRRKSVFDFNFMFEGLSDVVPFDMETYQNSTQRFVVVATDIATGQPVYFEKDTCSDFYAAGAASASMPLFSPTVLVDGIECLDGGVSDPIPVQKAIEDGYEKIVVVLTRHKGFRKAPLPLAEKETAKRMYKDKTELLDVIFSANEKYNETLAYIEKLEEEGRVFVIRPSEAIDISFLETNTDRLGYLYQQGITDGRKCVGELKKYLGMGNDSDSVHDDITKYKIGEYINTEWITERVEKMNSFGPRFTGTQAHKKYIKWLKHEIHKIGIETYTDPYFFNRWEEKESSVVIHGASGDVNIPVSSVFPYSGETPEEGVTGELEFIKEKHIDYLNVKDKIAVIKIDKMDYLPSTLAFNKRRSNPEGLELPENYTGPVATSFVNFPFLKVAKLAGAKAAVCIWEGMSDECIEGQYLPFILDYQGLPAVWVNATDGQELIGAAINHRMATLRLTAEKEENASSESFYCILRGEESGESVIVNTHTDGTNCIEENGAIAMLALMDCLKDKKLKRTHIFVFVTGHFRLPMFKSSQGGGMQATSKWLSSHPDLWDGKNGHLKAVAGLAIEHLGCMEWKDIDNKYVKTGEIETEIVYTGSNIMDEIYYRALENRKHVRTITLRGHNFLHFGEGQPLFNVHIPDIALVTAPDSLCTVSDSNEMEKFSAELMLEQTQTFLNCITIIDDMPRAAIGNCDSYSTVAPLKKLFRRRG